MRWRDVFHSDLDRSFLLFFTIDMVIIAVIGLSAYVKGW